MWQKRDAAVKRQVARILLLIIELHQLPPATQDAQKRITSAQGDVSDGHLLLQARELFQVMKHWRHAARLFDITLSSMSCIWTWL